MPTKPSIVFDQSSDAAILDEALRVFEIESEAVKALSQSLNESFVSAVRAIYSLKGRLIVSGIGKSGHVARKIAATLASTGQPSYFVHAAEASHGDLGMITKEDGVLVLSSSGETSELKPLLSYARRFAIPIIAMTKNRDSALGSCADHLLVLPDIEEACAMKLAPTTSTTMMMAMGDAVAVCLLKIRGFSAKDYGLFHPGGSLGQQLTTVADRMHKGRALPLTTPEADMSGVIEEMTSKRFGCIGVVDQDDNLLGIITDGDLRRFLQTEGTVIGKKAKDLMKKDPITVSPHTLMADALRMMQERSITSIFIVDEASKPIGLIHIHDFLKSGVI